MGHSSGSSTGRTSALSVEIGIEDAATIEEQSGNPEDARASIFPISDTLLEHCLLYLDTESLLQWRCVSSLTTEMFATKQHAKRHVQQILLELYHSTAHLKHTSSSSYSGRDQSKHMLQLNDDNADISPPEVPAIMNIGHKGAAGIVPPGNTLASFHKAVELGVDMIEFDVVLCNDGLLVHHDALEEQTGRWLASMSMAEASRLLGYPHPPLDEMLRDEILLNSGVQLYFDLKHTKIVRPTMRAIENAVVKYGWDASRFLVATFTHVELLEINAFRNAIPELKGLRTAAILDGIPLSLAKDFENLECSVVSVGRSCCQPQFIEDCHRRGLSIYCWTVNSKYAVEEMIRLGVDGICTDYPELVTEAKNQHVAAPITPRALHKNRKAEAALGSVYSTLGDARTKAVEAIGEARLFSHVVKNCGEAANFLQSAAPGEAAHLGACLASAEGVAEAVLHPLVSSPLALRWVEDARKNIPGRELLASVADELASPRRCQSPYMLPFERGFLADACGLT